MLLRACLLVRCLIEIKQLLVEKMKCACSGNMIVVIKAVWMIKGSKQ